MVDQIRVWLRQHTGTEFHRADIAAALEAKGVDTGGPRSPAFLLAWQKARDLEARENGIVFVNRRGTGRYYLADDKQRLGKASRFGRKAVRARERQRDTLAAIDVAKLGEGEAERARRATEKNAEMLGLEKALAYRRAKQDPAVATKPAENPRHQAAG